MTTGARDLMALGLAIAGLVVAGPMELFLIEAAAVQYGGCVVWSIMLVFYGLIVLCMALMTRPRLVIYNVTSEQLLPVLEEVWPRPIRRSAGWETASSRSSSACSSRSSSSRS